MGQDGIRIVIVDDESLLRQGLLLMLDGADGMRVVGQAGDGKEAIEVIQREQPDVVLMDIRMPVMNGIETVRSLRELGNSVPVIILTAFDTDSFILHSLEAGAVGFLLKTTAPDALVRSIRAAVAGQNLLSTEVLAKLIDMAGSGDGADSDTRGGGGTVNGTAGMAVDASPHAGVAARGYSEKIDVLSPREKEVAVLISQGLGNAEIAERLFISIPTVKTHVARILEKMQVENRVQIAVTMLSS